MTCVCVEPHAPSLPANLPRPRPRSRLCSSFSLFKEGSLAEANRKRQQQRAALDYNASVRRLGKKREQVAKTRVRVRVRVRWVLSGDGPGRTGLGLRLVHAALSGAKMQGKRRLTPAPLLPPPPPPPQAEVDKKAALLAQKQADLQLSAEQLRDKYEAEHVQGRLQVR